MKKLDLKESQPKNPIDAHQSTTEGAAETTQGDTPTMKKFGSKHQKKILMLGAVAILLGALTGWGTHELTAKTTTTNTETASNIEQVPEGEINAGDIFGNPNTEVFKDTTEGYLEAGGLDGEGSHKLLRPGGPSQTVYLTSSVTDLDKFVGMEVKIAGETFKGQKAGWLMDVGQVEVVNTTAEAPVQ